MIDADMFTISYMLYREDMGGTLRRALGYSGPILYSVGSGDQKVLQYKSAFIQS